MQFNGMAHAAVDLACAQSQLGHQVAICCGNGGFDDVLLTHGVEIFRMPAPRKSHQLINSLFGIYHAIRRFRPDVIHVHMVASALLTWPIARLFQLPFITSVQNSFSRAAAFMTIGDRVITGCQAVATTMNSRGIPKRKLRPVLNGTIGTARYPRAATTANLQRPAVITVCGLHPRKGIPDLIRGFETAHEQLPDIHLYIVGEGPCEAEYRAMVKEATTGHVHFISATPDPRPYMRAADMFVLASLADPAPLIIAEAREAGLAIVGTAVDGIPELLEFGDAGILIQPQAPEQISRSIVDLLSDHNKLTTWRANSQRNIDRLTVERVAIETVAVYSEVVAPHVHRQQPAEAEALAIESGTHRDH